MVEQKVSGLGFAKQPAQGNNEVKIVVRWLVANGYPALPVAPFQDHSKFPAKT
ncbi:MAG: hypothetical protein KME42_28320 [Tildeniella nuda ZEHNDER 1965/U140]|jgi:hypothetical protein|nr:hypothetical protein [Tildeniella nuda ZEHNDER 1965/U140]